MKNRKIWAILTIFALLIVSYFMSGSPLTSDKAQTDTMLTESSEKELVERNEENALSEKEKPTIAKDEEADKTSEDKKNDGISSEDKASTNPKQKKEDPDQPQTEQKKEPQDPSKKSDPTADEGERNKSGKDKYLTDPVPEGKPLPVEPDEAVITDKQMTATLSVRCDTLLDNLDRMNQEKVELVPKDGVIFPETRVTFYEGESVFNVLQREMKRNKIHMEFVNTPKYNSAYIEGIHNLYEFDGGQLSGWMYKVNGWYPNYGCSRYQLKDGDVIEWVYTCDLGRDVGGYIPGVED